MNEQNLQPNEPDQSSKNIWSIIISVLVTAIIVGGGVYAWQSSILKATEQNRQQQIVTLQNQINQLKQEEPTNQQKPSDNNLYDELIEAKLLLELRYFSVWNVFRDPGNKNKFYYATPPDGAGNNSITEYDLSRDITFQQQGWFNISEGHSLLYQEKLEENKEFRIIGVTGNKIVFVETYEDDSPGPCFSPWIGYKELNYIETNTTGIINTTEMIKKKYTVPDDVITRETEKRAECIKTL